MRGVGGGCGGDGAEEEAALVIWRISHRNDPAARELADRHYNRQSVGAPGFVPPGRCLVLYAGTSTGRAFWVTSYPFTEHVRHDWAGAWMNSAFRNEGADCSSEMIRAAVAATRWKYGDAPPLGMVTFVDPTQVRHKRDPGRCYKKAGFIRPACVVCKGEKKKRRTCKRCKTSGLARTAGGLIVWQLLPAAMPPPEAPIGSQVALFGDAA